MSRKPPWHAPADADGINGLFIPDEPPPDVAADLDRFHRMVASGELTVLLRRIAALDPNLTSTRH